MYKIFYITWFIYESANVLKEIREKEGCLEGIAYSNRIELIPIGIYTGTQYHEF